MPYKPETLKAIKEEMTEAKENAPTVSLPPQMFFYKPKKTGRPRKFSSPIEIAEEAHAFINWCYDNNKKATITRLAFWLGFNQISQIHDYIGFEDEFSETLKRIMLFIESEYEEGLLTARNPAGWIFTLKQLGWKDTQEVEVKKTMSIDDATEVLKGLGIEIE